MIFGLKHFREIIGEGLRLTLKRISCYTESQESVEILPSEIVKKTADEMPSLVSGVKTMTAGRTEAIGRPQSSPMNPSNPSADQKPMTHWVYSSMITFLLGWLFFAVPVLLLSQYPERRKFGRRLSLVIATFILAIGISARIKQDTQVIGWWLSIPLVFVALGVLSKWRKP